MTRVPLPCFSVLRLLLCSLAVFFLAPLPSFAARWKTLKTDAFTVFYKPGDEPRATKLLSALEKGRPPMERLTGHSVRRCPVVLQDMGTLVNSLTDPLNEVIQLFPASPGCRNPAYAEDWLLEVGAHEYVHILNLSQSGGLSGLAKGLLGSSVNANLLNPGWATEGLAVLGESRLSPQVGRLNDGTFAAIAASQSRDGRRLSLSRATHLPWEFPVGFHYLSGGLFHGYLADTYGVEKVTAFYADHSSRILQFLSPIFPAVGMDRAAKKAFGGSIPRLWEDWRSLTRGRGAPDIEGQERLTRRGWTMDGLQIRDGKAYYLHSAAVKTAARSGFESYRVVERDLDTGRERILTRMTAPFTGPLRVHGGRLLFATGEVRRGYPNTTRYGYESRLWELDLATGKRKVVFEGPFRAYEAMEDGAILLSFDRKDAFGSHLVRSARGGEPQTLRTSDDLVDEFLRDGERLFATARREGGTFDLYECDLQKGGLRRLVGSPWMERVEGVYGNRVVFTANRDKSYGIYTYDLKTGGLEGWTKGGYAVCGAFDERNGSLYGIGLSEEGCDLYRYPARKTRAVFTKEVSPREESDPLEGIALTRGGYGDNLKRLAPRVLHAPFGIWTPEERFYGLALSGGDAVYDFPLYVVAMGYDELRERPVAEILLTSAFFSPLVLGGQYQSLYGENTFTVTALTPLALRLSPGLASLWLGVTGRGYDDLTRRELEPTLSCAFHGAGFEVSTRVQAPMERRSWGGLRDRDALYGSLTWRQGLPGSQLRLSGIWVEDPENVDNPFGHRLGYEQDLEERRGALSSAEFSLPFLKVRRGLWNPCLYAEDLVLGLLAEGAWGIGGRSQVSYGARLCLETSLTTAALPLDLGIRYMRTREGGEEVAATLAFNLPIGIGNKPDLKGVASQDDGMTLKSLGSPLRGASLGTRERGGRW